MSDLVALVRTFVRVVEARSFTAVATELNTSQPTISRQIAALEEQVGARLFQRTTRALTLTDDGRVLYEQARQALDTVQQALGSVGRQRRAPQGTLRYRARWCSAGFTSSRACLPSWIATKTSRSTSS